MALIESGLLWSDIQMLPHNGDIISSKEVEEAIVNATAVDPVHYAGGVYCHECTHNLLGFCGKKGLQRVKPEGFCSDGQTKEDFA